MRVVLVHDWFTGVGQSLQTLQSLATLFPESKIVTMYYDNQHLPHDISRHPMETSFLQKVPGRAKYSYHLMPLYPRAITRFKFDDIDLMISNSQGFAKAARACKTALHVCYFHQPIPLAWQPLDQQYPLNEINSLRYRFIENLATRFRQWDIDTAAGVGLFISNSEASQRAIRRIYDRPSKVIYPPIDTDFFTPGPPTAAEYFLMIGPTIRRRRIDIAIETFRNIREKLIIAGDGPDFFRLVNMSSSNVNLTGLVDNTKLRELYRDCKALIVTSQSDFSMAAIEAAACGKPVICLGESGIRETLSEQITPRLVKTIAGSYGIYTDECSTVALKEAIKVINKTEFDPEQLRNNALRFSRQAFFQNMQGFLSEAYSMFRRDGLLNLEQRLLG